MQALEHRIPPPLVAVGIAAGMWLIARFSFVMAIDATLRFGLVAAFALAAGAFGVLGFNAFGRAGTTIDPLPRRPGVRARHDGDLPRDAQPDVCRTDASAVRLGRLACGAMGCDGPHCVCGVHHAVSDYSGGTDAPCEIWSAVRGLPPPGSPLGLTVTVSSRSRKNPHRHNSPLA